MTGCVRVKVTGVVQGVGFRPFVYDLAQKYDLGGYVLNNSHGVEIEIEGEDASIEQFLNKLKNSPPRLSIVRDVETERFEPQGKRPFEILESKKQEKQTVLISPDYATCPACLRELFDSSDRRYRYPFINCTNCGPRYTIIRGLPYDRFRTTMSEFEMCAECRSEYKNPRDRRFHAEATCCPICGPKVSLVNRSGVRVECADPLDECIKLLADGKIIAIKGLGGFHLACDASSDEAVRELRRRKCREEKPLAIMVNNVNIAKIAVFVSKPEERILSGSERPILLVKKGSCREISELIAPKSKYLGVMLPYTPLHHLLMTGPYFALVMTSGNVTDEPIAYKNEDALNRLSDIADYFLLHNRDIHVRTDDTVTCIISGKLRFLRRSRGYAPFPIELPFDTEGKEILAVGAELKNTVCLTQGRFAFLSHHIGDLRNSSAYSAFLQAIEHISGVLEISPRAIACDTHPGYLPTKYAHECGLPLIQVQHHHAHIASVLAEKGMTAPVIGVCFDGFGWGENGEVWGGEFLVCDLFDYERFGHLELLPLPGGDATARRPYRMAYVYLRAAFGEKAEETARRLLPSLSDSERNLVSRMIERNFNAPLTSSAGRLFDAASAILGVCNMNTYEGQAPMELEGKASEAGYEEGLYPARIEEAINGRFVIRTTELIKNLIEDLHTGVVRENCAARFHNSVAYFALGACKKIKEKTGLSTVALSGGVFANSILTEKLKILLEAEGYEVLTNSLVPTGDGGLSLGQAAVAAWRLKCA